MKNPLVSAVIAVRNGENYLSDAIESILRQDYENIEIWRDLVPGLPSDAPTLEKN